MANKLIVISADALVKEDVDYMKTLPGYQKYLQHCSRVEQVRSVYPTITYPCHTTMCTGVWPDKHRVTGNLLFLPGHKGLPWKWFAKYNQWDEDLFKAAKRAGLRTAAVFWPVTGNHPDIDYLIDEYWPQSPSDTAFSAFERSGSSPEMLAIIKKNYEGVEVRKHPGIDQFIIDCTCDILRQYAPDLVMIHPANIDGYRHGHGLFNDVVNRSVEETDGYVRQIMETLEELHLTEEYNVVLTSDHGQINIRRIVNINTVFREHGLIRVNEDGELVSWDAWCQAGGTSALVTVSPDVSRSVCRDVETLLRDMLAEGKYGIGSYYSREYAKRCFHLDGNFDFVLETDGITAFGDAFTGDYMREFDISDYRYGHATHGHLPDKGPQPVFLGIGPAFRKDAWIENGQLIDEAPTFAKILGIELRGADGSPMDALLNEP